VRFVIRLLCVLIVMGVVGLEKKKCPEGMHICGEKCEVFSRVVGYMRPVDQWNDGKRQEFKDRKVFKVDG